MTGNYREAKAGIRAPEAQPGPLRREELRGLLLQMRRTIRAYGITPDQLFGPDLSDLVRFRDPETGKTWNGLGRPSNWIRGKDRDRYRVG